MSVALVDTHALLWFLSGDEQLSQPAREMIGEPENIMVVSAACVWEIAIKGAIGKLKAPADLLEIVRGHGFGFLAIEAEHAWAVRQLPLSDHKDPFDRQLVAQALVEGMPVISRDSRLDRYGIERIW